MLVFSRDVIDSNYVFVTILSGLWLCIYLLGHARRLYFIHSRVGSKVANYLNSSSLSVQMLGLFARNLGLVTSSRSFDFSLATVKVIN